MADINPTIPTIALNVNGLNKPTERDYQSESKNKGNYMLSTSNLP